MLRPARRIALVAFAALVALALGGCDKQSAATTSPVNGSGAVPAGAPTGTPKIEGPVQRIPVDVSTGQFVPSVIQAKAGVPLEITFGQGQGCVSKVLIPAFGVDQDLTQGGAAVKLPAMKAGSYDFSCGMQMVFGKIEVR